MLFHLGDTFFFMNELVKTQATTNEENEVFIKILEVIKLKLIFSGK